MDGKFRHWREGTAVLSLIIWLILTPFMATIWVYDNGRFIIWERKPLLVRTIGQWLAEQGAFTFAAKEVVYFSYGRYFCLVYLLLIPTLMAWLWLPVLVGEAILTPWIWPIYAVLVGIIVGGQLWTRSFFQVQD